MIQDDDLTVLKDVHDAARAVKKFKENLKSEIGTYHSTAGNPRLWSSHKPWPDKIKLVYDQDRVFDYACKYMFIYLEKEEIEVVVERAIIHNPITSHSFARRRVKEVTRELTEVIYQHCLESIREGKYDEDLRFWRAKVNFGDKW